MFIAPRFEHSKFLLLDGERVKKNRVVCLVSGGIDSPVACALVAGRFDVVPLHFCLYPYTCEETFLLTMKVLKDLKSVVKFDKAIVYPWAKVMDAILKNKEKRRYACLACRKSMFKVAEIICEREGAVGIVTGESMGQKASQTLSNLGATSKGIKFPILRPLLGLDKEEIEKLSKKIGIWHEVHAGCCYSTPKYPRTSAEPKVLDDFVKSTTILGVLKWGFERALETRTFEENFEEYLESLA
jgi:thiamine biosynthesis protein ThiI